jgi:outer membrane scaffolding protein for murein synthesis (MipA/OmpV family)
MIRGAAFVFLLAPLLAFAQENPILLGAQVRSRPDFDGSKNQVIDVIPTVRYYGSPWFARTTQGILEGGVRRDLGNGLAVGAQLAYEAAGKNVDWGASGGLHVEWDTKVGPAPVNLLGRVRQNIDTDRGAQADLRGTVGVYGSNGVQAGVFAQATWGNSKWTRAYYDVSGGGLVYVSAGALASYDLSRHWLLVGSIEARRLQGDVKDSPFVETRSAYYANAGVAYRF